MNNDSLETIVFNSVTQFISTIITNMWQDIVNFPKNTLNFIIAVFHFKISWSITIIFISLLISATLQEVYEKRTKKGENDGSYSGLKFAVVTFRYIVLLLGCILWLINSRPEVVFFGLGLFVGKALERNFVANQ